MGNSKDRVAEIHGGQSAAHHHIVTRLAVMLTVKCCSSQSTRDQFNRLFGQSLGEGIAGAGDISLNGVGQRVHTGKRGNNRGQAHGQFRITDGRGGDIKGVANANEHISVFCQCRHLFHGRNGWIGFTLVID